MIIDQMKVKMQNMNIKMTKKKLKNKRKKEDKALEDLAVDKEHFIH